MPQRAFLSHPFHSAGRKEDPAAPLARTQSIVVSRLQEIDPIPAYPIDQPVLLRDPPGPASGERILQGLRLPNTGKRLTQDGFHQLKGPKGDLTIGFHPVTQVFAELRVEYGFPLGRARQSWAYPSPASRKILRTGAGLPLPPVARLRAVNNRWAFLGDRSRWAVSTNPASSPAGIRATS